MSITDAQILEVMRPSLNDGDGGYLCDTGEEYVIAAGRALLALTKKCCEISAEDKALLQAGDYTPEELFGVGGKPSCPKCV